MRTFADSFECRSGAHCVTCRATEPNGIRFRASLAKAFCLPQIVDDNGFLCPHGRPWDVEKGSRIEMPQGEIGDGGCNCGGLADTQRATDRPASE